MTVAAAFLAISASGEISDQRSQLDSVEAALAQVQTTAPSASPAVAGLVAQERTDRVAALAAALSTRVRFDRLLRELAYVLPADVWLTGLTASAPAERGTCRGGDSLHDRGRSHDHGRDVLAGLRRPGPRSPERSALARPRATRGDEPERSAGRRCRSGHEEQEEARAVVTFTISGSLATGSTS